MDLALAVSVILPPWAFPVLVGKKRAYNRWWVLVSFYLPGNRTPPPLHSGGPGTPPIRWWRSHILTPPVWLECGWWSNASLTVCILHIQLAPVWLDCGGGAINTSIINYCVDHLPVFFRQIISIFGHCSTTRTPAIREGSKCDSSTTVWVECPAPRSAVVEEFYFLGGKN